MSRKVLLKLKQMLQSAIIRLHQAMPSTVSLQSLWNKQLNATIFTRQSVTTSQAVLVDPKHSKMVWPLDFLMTSAKNASKYFYLGGDHLPFGIIPSAGSKFDRS